MAVVSANATVETAPVSTAAPRVPILLTIAVSVAIGVAMGMVFLLFEWFVNHGDTFIWDDVFATDTHRWLVVPLAIVLSVAFSFLVRFLGQKRIVPIHVSLLDEDQSKPIEPTSLATVGVILAIGAASLLAGASLGPEAALVATAMALGAWVSFRFGLSQAAQVIVLASLTALLVAFFGSLVPLLIPPLIMYQRTKSVPLPALVPPVLAGLAAYGTILLVRGQVDGYGSVPAGSVTGVGTYLVAIGIGICAVGVGWLLRQAIYFLSEVAKGLDARLSWPAAAALFGLILGVLYLIGGETTQFSGSEGTKLLLSDTGYGTAALAGIVVVKLVVTAWSLSAGYRGGLVFPSVFMGVALALFLADLFGGTAGPGLVVGGVAGILVEMTSPVLGLIMLLSLLPTELLPLGVAGAFGAVLPHAIYRRVNPKPPAAATAEPAAAPAS